MVKVILFVKRKDGFTREQFIKRYEEGHVPLAMKHLANLKKYTRNYVISDPGEKEMDYDVITEFSWKDQHDANKDRESYERVIQVLTADEDMFMNRESMKTITVEERNSDI